jgi:hypothetical protein
MSFGGMPPERRSASARVNPRKATAWECPTRQLSRGRIARDRRLRQSEAEISEGDDVAVRDSRFRRALGIVEEDLEIGTPMVT